MRYRVPNPSRCSRGAQISRKRPVHLPISVLILAVAATVAGCASQRSANYLVPALTSTEASLKVDATLCRIATIVSTTQLLLYSDERRNLYLQPSDDVSPQCEIVKIVPKGSVLTDIHAMRVNLVDASDCLLRFKLSGETQYVHMDDFEVETLLGTPARTPKSKSWVCSQRLSVPDKSPERTPEK